MSNILFDTVLHVGLNAPVVQKFLRKYSSRYHYIDSTTRNLYDINLDILRMNSIMKPSLIFFQIQHGNPISPDTLQQLNGITVNWTGDVREVIPEIFTITGKYFDYNMFTNVTDVDKMIEMGINANYLQIGLDSEVYSTEYKISIDCSNIVPKDIVFMANNYLNRFPLSKMRAMVSNTLRINYHDRFGLYGSGWGNLADGMTNNLHDVELYLYRNCKIAINISHFDYKRYSSDRIFRIMGSGAFCMSKWYPEIELDFTDKEHLVVWYDIDDLLEKISYYLEHEDERNVIAKSGYDLVHKYHTWDERLIEMKSIISSNPKFNSEDTHI